MIPKWTEAQQGHQFNQWVIDTSRYELETATPIEESIKIATAINNLRGAARQHWLLSIRPTTTWREVHNITQNLLVSTWVPQDAHISTIEEVNYIKKGKGKRKKEGKGKGKPTTTTVAALLGKTTKVKEKRGRTTASSTTSNTTTPARCRRTTTTAPRGKNNSSKGKGKSGKGEEQPLQQRHLLLLLRQTRPLHIKLLEQPQQSSSCPRTTSAL